MRMALGAEARAVVAAVLGRTASLVAVGIAAGGIIAWLMSRWLRDVLFETSSIDPITYAAVVRGNARGRRSGRPGSGRSGLSGRSCRRPSV